MIRRLLAASFAAATLSVLSMAPASAQASPPTSASAQSSSVAADTASNALPRTGSDIGPQVYLGSGLAAAGIGLVVVARRRRSKFSRAPRHAAA